VLLARPSGGHNGFEDGWSRIETTQSANDHLELAEEPSSGRFYMSMYVYAMCIYINAYLLYVISA
jgi:hypothetical protein